MSFICGFSGNQEDDLEDLCMLPSTPQRKTTRRPSFCSRSNKNNKNPYSNRGLDKFEALLTDLDGKRQMIYTEKGSEDISLVRFIYSNSNDVKPIVVKFKDRRKQEKHQRYKLENDKTRMLSTSEHLVDGGSRTNSGRDAVVQVTKPSIDCKKSVVCDQLRRNIGEWWRPWYSLPVFVMLILVFLVFFGRSFTIFCTSIGWYLVPTTNETSETLRRQKKQRKLVTSPRSVFNSRFVNTAQRLNPIEKVFDQV